MFHRAHEHPDGFTVIDNGLLLDKNLSLKAIGLMTRILQLPDDWIFCTRGFKAILPAVGRTSIEGAAKELEEAGYIKRLPQGRGPDGRMLPAVWEIYERPVSDGSAARDPP